MTTNERTLTMFRDAFTFDPKKTGYVGIELEGFCFRDGRIAPIAEEVLGTLPNDGRFTYELSACQIELRVGPCATVEDLGHELQNTRALLARAEAQHNFKIEFVPLAPATMPLDVFPNPRYANITRHLSEERLRAACRVAALHVHVGMSGHDLALAVHNQALVSVPLYMRSYMSQERRAVYEVMAPGSEPVVLRDWDHFETLVREGQPNADVLDPRGYYKFLRVSKHGTLELRVPDTTSSEAVILEVARRFQTECLWGIVQSE